VKGPQKSDVDGGVGGGGQKKQKKIPAKKKKETVSYSPRTVWEYKQPHGELKKQEKPRIQEFLKKSAPGGKGTPKTSRKKAAFQMKFPIIIVVVRKRERRWGKRVSCAEDSNM